MKPPLPTTPVAPVIKAPTSERPLTTADVLPIPPYTPPDPTKPDLPQSLAPTTTAQEDVITAGQRRINLIWEITQSIIAVGITGAAVFGELTHIRSDIIANAFFLVVGVYIQRVNHNRIGGVGAKATDNQKYEGR